jgi:hypothetical protein
MKPSLWGALLVFIFSAAIAGRGLAQGASGGAQNQPTATSPTAVVQQLGDAFNRRDWQALGALIADSIVYHQIGDTVVRRQSRADFLNDIRKFVGANPQEHRAVLNRIVTGRFVADHERATGLADGRPREAIDVFEVRDGRVVSEWESPLLTPM